MNIHQRFMRRVEGIGDMWHVLETLDVMIGLYSFCVETDVKKSSQVLSGSRQRQALIDCWTVKCVKKNLRKVPKFCAS